jgi:hypothetical protein
MTLHSFPQRHRLKTNVQSSFKRMYGVSLLRVWFSKFMQDHDDLLHNMCKATADPQIHDNFNQYKLKINLQQNKYYLTKMAIFEGDPQH